MRTIFDPQTKEKASGQPRVLLMDGHNSHFSLSLLEYCLENNIVVISYPAHCTHALQGLDVVCFAKMKRIWHAALDEHYKSTGVHVNKATYARVFGTAFLQAFDEETIRAAFKATGVHPYDPTVITEQQMKPSETTSTKSVFPLPMNSPVRNVLAVYYEVNHKHENEHEHEDEPGHGSIATLPLPIAGPSSDTLSGASQHQHVGSEPSTPVRAQHTPPDCIDPSLFTPSKRARVLHASFASSKSGNILVSKPRVDSLMKPLTPVIEREPYLPEPDWGLLRTVPNPECKPSMEAIKEENDRLRTNLGLAYKQVQATRAINEAANAQLIVQHIQAGRMKTALQEKERTATEKKGLRIGGDGKAVIYTSPDVMTVKRKYEEETQLKTAKREARAVLRAQIRVAKDRIEREWVEICRLHTASMAEWKTKTDLLKQQKIPRSQWPKAPIRPKKPTMPPELRSQTRRRAAVVEEQDQGGSVSQSDDGNGTDGD